MIYDWYNIFNYTEFQESGLVSRTLNLLLTDIGAVEILVTKGNVTGILIEDIYMPIQFAGKNPYARTPYAVYQDENDDVWLGFEVEE